MPTKAERSQREREARRSKAMAHTVRAAAFRVLREGPATPAEVARQINESTPTVAYHIRQLEKLECVEVVDTRISGSHAQRVYRAVEDFLIKTEDWEALDPIVKEERGLEFAQAHVDDLVLWAGYHGGRDKHFHLTGNHYSLDQEGLERVMEIFEEARLACEAEAVAADQRLAKSKAKSMRVATMHGVMEIPPTK